MSEQTVRQEFLLGLMDSAFKWAIGDAVAQKRAPGEPFHHPEGAMIVRERSLIECSGGVQRMYTLWPRNLVNNVVVEESSLEEFVRPPSAEAIAEERRLKAHAAFLEAEMTLENMKREQKAKPEEPPVDASTGEPKA